jgi:lysozyme family protein
MEPGIAAEINACEVIPARATYVRTVASHLLVSRDQYAAVHAAIGIPIIVCAAIHYRESNADFGTYLGNGDPLDRPTKHVPRGRGGFKTWYMGAIDALTLDRLNQVNDWTWERAIYEWTLYNGFGPLDRGKQSGYPWGGTNIYTGGKYVRDGVWDPDWNDTQLGCYPIACAMVSMDASLDLPRFSGALPPPDHDVTKPVAPPPGIGEIDVKKLQAELNSVSAHPPLVVDGSYGRMTRRAVEDFQDRSSLTVDGLAGPETVAALTVAALARVGAKSP